MSEYDYSEDDLKTGGGGGNSVLPVGDYTFTVEKAETKKDKNGKAYLSLELEVAFGSHKKRKVWDNYLTLDKDSRQFKRTASFLQAIGHKSGVPVGAPGGAPASALAGTFVDMGVSHTYENVPGKEWPVRSWERDFKEVQASGALKGITPKAEAGWYRISDEFEGIGSPGDSGSAESPWG